MSVTDYQSYALIQAARAERLPDCRKRKVGNVVVKPGHA
jgi:hypothetical protein